MSDGQYDDQNAGRGAAGEPSMTLFDVLLIAVGAWLRSRREMNGGSRETRAAGARAGEVIMLVHSG